MKKLEPFPIEVLKIKISDCNESIMSLAGYLKRKKVSRFGMTKAIARKRMRLVKINRDSLKQAINILRFTHKQ